MAVSRRLRFEVLRRDNYTCRYCGAKAPDATLTVDHVMAIALGGGDEPNNLVTACADCNAGKSSTTADAALVEDVDATAMLFAKAMEKANQIRQGEIGDADRIIEEWDELWRMYGDHFRPDDWIDSMERFLASGLNRVDLIRFLQSTYGRTRSNYFRYFCGCCWREISDRQEIARRLIEDGQV